MAGIDLATASGASVAIGHKWKPLLNRMILATNIYGLVIRSSRTSSGSVSVHRIRNTCPRFGSTSVMMIVGVLNRKKVLGRLSGDNTEY